MVFCVIHHHILPELYRLIILNLWLAKLSDLMYLFRTAICNVNMFFVHHFFSVKCRDHYFSFSHGFLNNTCMSEEVIGVETLGIKACLLPAVHCWEVQPLFSSSLLPRRFIYFDGPSVSLHSSNQIWELPVGSADGNQKQMREEGPGTASEKVPS